MADAKKTGLFDKPSIALQAQKGFALPVRYKGAWVWVREEAPTEFECKALAYETKIEIKRAVAANHIQEAKLPAAPAAAPAKSAPAPTVAASPNKAKES